MCTTSTMIPTYTGRLIDYSEISSPISICMISKSLSSWRSASVLILYYLFCEKLSQLNALLNLEKRQCPPQYWSDKGFYGIVSEECWFSGTWGLRSSLDFHPDISSSGSLLGVHDLYVVRSVLLVPEPIYSSIRSISEVPEPIYSIIRSVLLVPEPIYSSIRSISEFLNLYILVSGVCQGFINLYISISGVYHGFLNLNILVSYSSIRSISLVPEPKYSSIQSIWGVPEPKYLSIRSISWVS